MTSPRTSGAYRAFAAFALSVSGLAGAGDVRPASFDVQWNGESLCIRSDNALRADLLREVARKTGATVRGAEHLGDRVTLRPACTDLGSSLRLLAGSASYALTELAPSPERPRTHYQLFSTAQGSGTRQANVMSKPAAVSVMVEDPVTGEMQVVPAPTQVRGAINARPDATPVSVRVDPY